MTKARTVEQMAYGAWFTTPADGKSFRLLDYCEQSITDDGGLCRDRPLRVENPQGRRSELPWGTPVKAVLGKGAKGDDREDPESES